MWVISDCLNQQLLMDNIKTLFLLLAMNRDVNLSFKSCHLKGLLIILNHCIILSVISSLIVYQVQEYLAVWVRIPSSYSQPMSCDGKMSFDCYFDLWSGFFFIFYLKLSFFFFFFSEGWFMVTIAGITISNNRLSGNIFLCTNCTVQLKCIF